MATYGGGVGFSISRHFYESTHFGPILLGAEFTSQNTTNFQLKTMLRTKCFDCSTERMYNGLVPLPFRTRTCFDKKRQDVAKDVLSDYRVVQFFCEKVQKGNKN